MSFQWDPNKAQSNRWKHGISFEMAVTIFADPQLLFTVDSQHWIHNIPTAKSESERLENLKMVKSLLSFLQCEMTTFGLLVLDLQLNRRLIIMNQDSDFPFDRARRVTPEENRRFKDAIAQQFGTQSRDRSAIPLEEPYESISLQLHPKIIVWAKAEAQKRGIEYQTIINEVLLQQVG